MVTTNDAGVAHTVRLLYRVQEAGEKYHDQVVPNNLRVTDPQEERVLLTSDRWGHRHHDARWVDKRKKAETESGEDPGVSTPARYH